MVDTYGLIKCPPHYAELQEVGAKTNEIGSRDLSESSIKYQTLTVTPKWINSIHSVSQEAEIILLLLISTNPNAQGNLGFCSEVLTHL